MPTTSSAVTTRFAPSPTGWIHVGNLRTALMNYLIARQNGGTFILRLDDTDQERSKQEYIDGLKADLAWLGITYDRIEQQASVSDPVLIKADGQVLYTFASSVDDVDMGVTHIVRGADHVTNTATQIQIMKALGGTPPTFAHHSLLTGPQGEELSKRLGVLSLRDLRARGVEPMALHSLMARRGSSRPV